jgi:hypothetical protein
MSLSRRKLAALRKATAASVESRRRAALEADARVLPVVREMRAAKLSYGLIAARLNELGYTTRAGACWFAAQVWRVLDRAGKESSR